MSYSIFAVETSQGLGINFDVEQERETDEISPDSVTSVAVQTRFSGRTGGDRSRLFYKMKEELSQIIGETVQKFFSNYHVSCHGKKIRVFLTNMYHDMERR